MEEDVNVVLVSNRGPVSFIQRSGDFQIKRGAGGLAGALDPVARRLGGEAVWIAAANSATDREALRAGAGDRLGERLGYPVYLLDIEPDVYSDYYDVVSNRMLWFANHCLFDEVGIDRFGADELHSWEHGYAPVNEQFAAAVCEASDPSSLVLFQDYHLTTAVGHVRAARPRQTILHFTHSSFCGPSGMSRLPRGLYEKVIEGMVGADLLGFHVRPWVEGFLDCCEDLGHEVDRSSGGVHVDGRTAWVRAYPIPIDARSLRKRAERPKAQKWAQRFRDGARGPIIVRADRTDPSKNIVRGFEAFGLLLDRRKDLRREARFVACLYPSRQTVPEYRRYIEKIEATVSRINDRHPDSIQLFMEDDFDRTLGALSVYDVLLVNSIMDGMNLVSKEGPTINDNDGVLVLSHGAGSFDELGEEAVRIEDPFDVEASAGALEAALELSSAERKERAIALRTSATERKPADWIGAQLDDLVRIKEGEAPATSPRR